jgi:hypothetical protein
MSSLWTPGGERPVGREAPAPAAAPSAPTGNEGAADEAELEARLEELRQQLAEAPVEGIVEQFAYQLFEIAALHLSSQPPNLAKAALAIDAMGALVEGLAGRLGANEQSLKDGLSQIRMAFVQIKNAASAEPPPPPEE